MQTKNVILTLTLTFITIVLLAPTSEAVRITKLTTSKNEFNKNDIKKQTVTFTTRRNKGKGGANQESGQELPSGMCLVDMTWHGSNAIRAKGHNCNIELIGGMIKMPRKVYCGCRLEPKWDGDARCSQKVTMYMVDCSIWLQYALKDQ